MHPSISIIDPREKFCYKTAVSKYRESQTVHAFLQTVENCGLEIP